MSKPIQNLSAFLGALDGNPPGRGRLYALPALCALFVLAALSCSAQVITLDAEGKIKGEGAPVDRRYAQIQPTSVPLPATTLDPRTRLDILRTLDAEQGFAMRPFPRGHKGLTLVANGKLEPAGEAYLGMVTSEGISAKPGDRVVLTDIKFEKSRIIFDLNGGPDHKLAFLRHIQVGSGPVMNPVVQGDDQDPTGARLTLTFKGEVPELTTDQIKALLAPLISFDLKTPIQAFTDTLPPVLKEAILNHHVMVGMSTDMVLFAKGRPERKMREMDGLMPFEEWIYGEAPQEVDFVRINGNRVIRLEVAKTGESPVIFTDDLVSGLMRTDGTPAIPGEKPRVRTVAEGDDAERDPDTQAPAAPPSLRKPGESLPSTPSGDDRVGTMRPVQMPKPRPETQPDGGGGSADTTAAPEAGKTQSSENQPAPSAGQPVNLQAPLPDASQQAPPKQQFVTGDASSTI
jgi:hypothetical protein